MSKRNYERWSIERFGEHLLESNDLDPVYVALVDSGFPAAQLKRWLIAYWCFYHTGVASYLSEREGWAFWEGMTTAAANEYPAPVGGRWPRGHERRHFRAKIALNSVQDLHHRYPDPEKMVDYIVGLEVSGADGVEAKPFHEISSRARNHSGFGPWIGFKIADMTDRVLGVPVAFTDAAVFMFDDPKEAALKLYELRFGQPHPSVKTVPKKDPIIHGIASYLIQHFSTFRAPPFYDRPVNIQEIETILCKWKSHMNGHYPLNNDIIEITNGVAPWAEVSPAAKTFLSNLPLPMNYANQ